MSSQEKETSNSLFRQWQILSRLSTGKWIGTRELQEMLLREGIDVSLRTIQRDLNQISQRFPIESSKTSPQGWRWHDDPRRGCFDCGTKGPCSRHGGRCLLYRCYSADHRIFCYHSACSEDAVCQASF